MHLPQRMVSDIGQYKTPDKTNEIKAIPPLLKMLEISDVLLLWMPWVPRKELLI